MNILIILRTAYLCRYGDKLVMKKLVLATITVLLFVVFVIHVASAEQQLNEAILSPFKDSELVLVGKVVQATSMDSNRTQYEIKVEKYLKGSQSFDQINAVGQGTSKKITNFDEVRYYNSPVFEDGDRVFLYLGKNGYQYSVLPYSFGIVKSLPKGGPPNYVSFTNYKTSYYGGDQVTVSGIIEKGYLYRSVADLGTNSSVFIIVNNPQHEKYFTDQIILQPDGSFDYKFKVKGSLGMSGSYEYGILVGTSLTGGTFDYVSVPLKQFKSGIPIDKIQCKEGLKLVIKSNDNIPLCVKSKTMQKLVERGWATPYSAKQ